MADVQVTDVGGNVLVSGPTEDGVLRTLLAYEEMGYRRIAAPARVGSKWMATLAKPGKASATTASHCTMERIGLRVFVRGPTKAAVEEAVGNLGAGGGKLVMPIEEIDGVWQALVDTP